MSNKAPFKERLRWKLFQEIGWPISIPMSEHDPQVALVEELVDSGQHRRAALHLFLLKKKYPGSAEVLRIHAYSCLARKQYYSAIKLFSDAAHTDSHKARNWALIAYCYHRLDEDKQCAEFLKLVRESGEEDHAAFAHYIRVIEERYPERLAEELCSVLKSLTFEEHYSPRWFKKLAKIDIPFAKGVLGQLEEVDGAKGFCVLTQAEFELVAHNYEKALDWLISRQGPIHPYETWLKLVRGAVSGISRAGTLESNWESLQLVVQFLQDLPLKLIHKDPGAIVECGKICLEFDPPDLRTFSRTPMKETAHDIFLYIYDRISEFEKIKMPYARLLIKMRRYEQALAILESFVSRRGSEEYYVLKASLMHKMGRAEEAKELVEAGFEAYPDSTDLMVQRIPFLLFETRTHEALKVFEELLKRGVRGAILRDYFRLLYSTNNRHLISALCEKHDLSITCEELEGLFQCNKLSASKASANIHFIAVDSLEDQIRVEQIEQTDSPWVLVSSRSEMGGLHLPNSDTSGFLTYRDSMQTEDCSVYGFAVRTDDLKCFLPNTAIGVLNSCAESLLERRVYEQIDLSLGQGQL